MVVLQGLVRRGWQLLQALLEELRLLLARPEALCFGLAGCIFSSLFFGFVLLTQLPLSAQLLNARENYAINQPIVIALSQSVSKSLAPSISPEIEGSWEYKRSSVGVRQLSFVPAETGLRPDTTYSISIKDLKRVTGQRLPQQQFSVVTESAPGVASVTPAKSTKNVPADSLLSVTLAGKNRGMRQLRLELSPKMTLEPIESSDDTTFSWKAGSLLQQGKTYILKVFDENSEGSKKPLKTLAFTTAKEPGITGKSKSFLYPGKTINVAFNTAMRTDAPGIRCECEGVGKWKNDKVYQFKPAKVEVNKTYTFVVPKGLRATSGGLRAKDAAYTIRTPGPVRASVAGLGNNANAGAPITAVFDQPVQRASAQAAFTLNPKVNGSFAWPNESTMVFTPSGYEQQTAYTANIRPGVTPVHFGLPGDAPASMQFTTEPQTVKLDVPAYAQQHPSSCEAASLRMALAFRKVHDVDTSIVQKMGYKPRSKDHKKNQWDDPNQMYVGNINGSQSRYEGYGAYAAPIANAARAYGRDASAHYGVGAGFVAQQIHAGNPVIIIGTVSHMSPIPMSWKGPNGTVHAWMGMHARTVVGVVGRADSPVGFWVNDPYHGTHEYWSTQRLVNDINPIPQVAGQVVVVR